MKKKELQTNLGNSNFIFVGSSTDMWAAEVPTGWIQKVIQHTKKYNNTYLFQTKFPIRFLEFIRSFNQDYILGTTLETNRGYDLSMAPLPMERWMQFKLIKDYKVRMMISIEPIMDFDLENFLYMLRKIKPEFISIGADSKKNDLIEPSSKKIKELIYYLKGFTKVIIKNNLNRLLE